MGANTTTYKRAGAYVTDPVLNETTGQFSANYTPGVSERRAGVSTFLHSGLKNADARTTDGSAVTADRQYDAFGNLTGGNGTWNGPFGYAGGYGYQEDGESGLKLLGHRYYDSTTGRFLSKDPIGDGRNWYSYCGNDPTSGADPAGLAKIVLFWYPVAAGGHHAGLLFIDNLRGKTEPTWSFSGGPERYGGWNNGRLVSKSGPWERGTQDYRSDYGERYGAIVLLDNDQPLEPYVAGCKMHEEDMANSGSPWYTPVPSFNNPATDPEDPNWPGYGNSNTWCRELVRRLGLKEPYERAVKKRGGAPWSPGWEVRPRQWR